MESPRNYRCQGIVLRRVNVGEADRIITLYTREKGKLQAIAKGARKSLSKLAGSTELFTYGRYFLASGRDLDILTQSEIKEPFPRIRTDLKRIAYATYFVELINGLIEEFEPNYELFDTLLSALYLLEGEVDPEIVGRYFELQVMSQLGYRPELDRCIRCDAEPSSEQIPFSPSLGGRVCEECGPIPEDVIYLSKETGDAMKRLLASDARTVRDVKLSDKAREELSRAMRWHVRYRLDKDLKSMDFIDSLSAPSVPPED